MKKLNKLLLIIMTMSITTIYGYASDIHLSSITHNKYKISVSVQDKVVAGDNKIYVKITHKGRIVHNANVNLSIYMANDNIHKYQSNQTNTNGNYSFNINLPKNGKYVYKVSFSQNGGVIRQLRSSFKI